MRPSFRDSNNTGIMHRVTKLVTITKTNGLARNSVPPKVDPRVRIWFAIRDGPRKSAANAPGLRSQHMPEPRIYRIAKPRVDRLQSANEETYYRTEQLDRLQMLTSYGQNQGLEFLNRILRNFFAHQPANVELRDGHWQTLAR